MKCRQLASGAVIYEDGNWVHVHDAKIEALQDIIEEANGEPVIVAYYFKSELDRLRAEFKQAVVFDGSEATLQRFIDGHIQVLLMHPLSDAHGIDDMQRACRIIAFFCPIWELEEYEQLIERIGPTRQVQAGFKRDVYVHVLVGENTIDEEMVERLKSKASVQEALLQAMKKRG
jgi:SNF2 family DNA or RNA helicase